MIGRLLVGLAAVLLTAPAHAAPADVPAILDKAGFKGFALVADPDRILWQSPRAPCPAAAAPDKIVLCHPRDPAFQRWPWASVTKQVLGVLVMRQVDAGRLALDTPASAYLPALGATPAGAPTIRQLLQHRSGLRNPEDSPKDAGGTPSWYRQAGNGLAWCLADRTAPGDWRYNNCDSVVLGALLERVTGRTVAQLFDRDLAEPLKLEASAFAGTTADRDSRQAPLAVPLSAAERALLTRFGAAGGLVGTPLDLLAFDRALLAGHLLSPAARDELWRGDPKLGFMALAQWSFFAPLKGCAAPVRIVERRGGIGRFQVRNLILPELNRILILFTADEAFDFGEIWQGKGLSHDLLATAGCGSSD